MFINPQTAIKNGWITGIKNPQKQIQPNAIDFTADKAFKLSSRRFYISETAKQMRGSHPYNPHTTDLEIQLSWELQGKDMLDFLSDVYVDLPTGVAAQLIIRSSLARNGLLLVSGLYDSGFKGHIGFLLHNCHRTSAIITQGTRVGQIVFIQSTSSELYTGEYNHGAGTDLEYQGGSLKHDDMIGPGSHELKEGMDLGHNTQYLEKK